MAAVAKPDAQVCLRFPVLQLSATTTRQAGTDRQMNAPVLPGCLFERHNRDDPVYGRGRRPRAAPRQNNGHGRYARPLPLPSATAFSRSLSGFLSGPHASCPTRADTQTVTWRRPSPSWESSSSWGGPGAYQATSALLPPGTEIATTPVLEAHHLTPSLPPYPPRVLPHPCHPARSTRWQPPNRLALGPHPGFRARL